MGINLQSSSIGPGFPEFEDHAEEAEAEFEHSAGFVPEPTDEELGIAPEFEEGDIYPDDEPDFENWN
jgi:hypothetical protein